MFLAVPRREGEGGREREREREKEREVFFPFYSKTFTVIVIRVEAPESDGGDLEDVERIQHFLKEKPDVALHVDVDGVGAVEQPKRRLQGLGKTGRELGPKPVQLFAPVVSVQPSEGLGARVEDVLDVSVDEKPEGGLCRSPKPGPIVGILVG